MKFRLMLLGFTAALLGIPDTLQAQKVIVNIWDGSERTVIDPLYRGGELPNLSSVGPMFQLTANEDCFDHPCTSGGTVGCMKTVTKPQHATMLTGVLADVHGVFANRPSSCFQLIPKGLTVYEKIEAVNPLNRTAHISSKPMHFGGKTFGNIIDVVDLFFAQSVTPGMAADQAIEAIKLWSDQNFFIVVHFKEPDEIGHVFGVESQEYHDAILENDLELGRILSTLADQGYSRSDEDLCPR